MNPEPPRSAPTNLGPLGALLDSSLPLPDSIFEVLQSHIRSGSPLVPQHAQLVAAIASSIRSDEEFAVFATQAIRDCLRLACSTMSEELETQAELIEIACAVFDRFTKRAGYLPNQSLDVGIDTAFLPSPKGHTPPVSAHAEHVLVTPGPPAFRVRLFMQADRPSFGWAHLQRVKLFVDRIPAQHQLTALCGIADAAADTLQDTIYAENGPGWRHQELHALLQFGLYGAHSMLTPRSFEAK